MGGRTAQVPEGERRYCCDCKPSSPQDDVDGAEVHAAATKFGYVCFAPVEPWQAMFLVDSTRSRRHPQVHLQAGSNNST
jgi:hypothetical protein